MLDSGCTQHMTGDRAMFTTFEVGGNEQEKVTFGDNSKGKVIGLGKIAISMICQLIMSLLLNL